MDDDDDDGDDDDDDDDDDGPMCIQSSPMCLMSCLLAMVLPPFPGPVSPVPP